MKLTLASPPPVSTGADLEALINCSYTRQIALAADKQLTDKHTGHFSVISLKTKFWKSVNHLPVRLFLHKKGPKTLLQMVLTRMYSIQVKVSVLLHGGNLVLGCELGRLGTCNFNKPAFTWWCNICLTIWYSSKCSSLEHRAPHSFRDSFQPQFATEAFDLEIIFNPPKTSVYFRLHLQAIFAVGKMGLSMKFQKHLQTKEEKFQFCVGSLSRTRNIFVVCLCVSWNKAVRPLSALFSVMSFTTAELNPSWTLAGPR